MNQQYQLDQNGQERVAEHCQDWYCVRTKVGQEMLAVSCLRKEAGLEAFSPRIRYKRVTRSGKRSVVKSLFPGYLFVLCSLRESFRHVLSRKGVVEFVRFGGRIPTLPDTCIEELRNAYAHWDDVLTVERGTLLKGDYVEIVDGAFLGMGAVVREYLPESDRVKILIDLLGREVPVSVPYTDVKKTG
ncbi:transcription termination/antitermination NusG family protein [Pelagicoccus sp. SDUM812003]|uniref:transcription termination/antitermination protein NusG n=1 Tax=Pelagicoccus sp. SDUM812003 TaxID=3041267 RepID=UPI00280E13F6|nr:transcription termination/antitermination NusG family protein [Pelagicoccus sp. SDUM812003]MDQ8203592.1 transcription termination/antitermination NusG family protein [Pelagicoccus sp. SDUM812003]